MRDFQRPSKNDVFTDWPKVDEVLCDDQGRMLTVQDVDPKSPLGRNVIGVINDRPYACDVITLLAVWKRSDT